MADFSMNISRLKSRRSKYFRITALIPGTSLHRIKVCRTYIFLFFMVSCAKCAPVQTDCMRCILPCVGVPDLSIYQSVIIYIKNHEKVEEKVHNVSSFCVNGACAVPGCFQKDQHYSLTIYENDHSGVSDTLYEKTHIQPVCQEQQTLEFRDSNGANRNILEKFLLTLTFCVCILQI